MRDGRTRARWAIAAVAVMVSIWATHRSRKLAQELSDSEAKLEKELAAAEAELKKDIAEAKAALDKELAAAKWKPLLTVDTISERERVAAFLKNYGNGTAVITSAKFLRDQREADNLDRCTRRWL